MVYQPTDDKDMELIVETDNGVQPDDPPQDVEQTQKSLAPEDTDECN